MRRFWTESIAMTKATQLLGISNAIVDILAHVEHALITEMGIAPGSMNLIDEQRAKEIYAMMGPATEMSGGSVANSIAGFANLGGNAAYIGRVHEDQFGEIFNHDMRSLGIDVRLTPSAEGAPTARSHVLITSDGQRTMNTYLGACTELSESDISAETVGAPKAILLEGYVWDCPEGPALARKAIDIAHQAGAAVALSLSDSFCVERHRDSFDDFVRNGVDIVLADEDEINRLVKTDSFDATLEAIKSYDNLFAITRSQKGSVIVHGDQHVVQAATPVETVVDSTGAGDAYSAGFMFGWANDYSLAECARLGTFCATTVIQQLGARIEPGLLDNYS
jgi:sugar/nucleoside kinase (ribokinase family)